MKTDSGPMHGQQPVQKKRMKPKTILIIVGVVLLLGVIGMIANFLEGEEPVAPAVSSSVPASESVAVAASEVNPDVAVFTEAGMNEAQAEAFIATLRAHTTRQVVGCAAASAPDTWVVTLNNGFEYKVNFDSADQIINMIDGYPLGFT